MPGGFADRNLDKSLPMEPRVECAYKSDADRACCAQWRVLSAGALTCRSPWEICAAQCTRFAASMPKGKWLIWLPAIRRNPESSANFSQSACHFECAKICDLRCFAEAVVATRPICLRSWRLSSPETRWFLPFCLQSRKKPRIAWLPDKDLPLASSPCRNLPLRDSIESRGAHS